jgi:photosystem II stability/assembly factor-like uncharacterized protein
MDTPSGNSVARVADLVTRFTNCSTVTKWTLVALTSLMAVGAGAPVEGQDEIAPEPSIMAPLASQALVLDAVSIDGALVAVGERGHILISTDGGKTWQQQSVPTRAALTGVFFHDQNLGWAVGHDGVILRTTDGGTTWKIVNWAPEDEEPFFDVWFEDAENGVAIGAYGAYYETTDGGTTWSSRWISEDDWHLHKIARSANGRMYIAAEAGSFYRSDDGGETWTTLYPDYEGSYFGVLPLEGDSVLLFGLRGHLFRSDDAGETWNEIETGTVAMLTDGIRLEDGTVVIVGLGGTVLVSSDDGQSFELHQQENRRGISSIVDVQDGSLLMVGEFGVRTTTLAELTAATD